MRPSSLSEFFQIIDAEMKFGANLKLHPNGRKTTGFHLPTICIATPEGPTGRVCTIREADLATGIFRFHSHAHAVKIAHLFADPRVELCFYDSKSGLQARVAGTASVHLDDAIADQFWDQTDVLGRRCYCGEEVPGEVSEAWTSGLAPHLADREPTLEESVAGRKNFAVIRIHATRMEAFLTDFWGHSRASWTRVDGEWNGSWLVP